MLHLLVCFVARHGLALEFLQPLLKAQVVERIMVLIHHRVRALHALDRTTGGLLYYRLFLVQSAEYQRGHLIEVLILAITRKQETAHPVTNQLKFTGGIRGQLLARGRKRLFARLLCQVPVELRYQLVRFLTNSKLLARHHLVKQVFARSGCIRAVEQSRVLREHLYLCHQCRNILRLNRVTREQLIALGETIELGRPELLRVRVTKLLPIHHRARAHSWMIPRKL